MNKSKDCICGSVYAGNHAFLREVNNALKGMLRGIKKKTRDIQNKSRFKKKKYIKRKGQKKSFSHDE